MAAAQEPEGADSPSGEDVCMEDDQQPAGQSPPAAAGGGTEGDPREWSGAQVVANADRLLLGHLDEEFADNPDPGDEDWDRPEDEGPGPDDGEQPFTTPAVHHDTMRTLAKGRSHAVLCRRIRPQSATTTSSFS